MATLRTVTIGPPGSGYDYTSLYNAVATEPKDLRALDRVLRFLCHPMIENIAWRIELGAFISDRTRYWEIVAADPHNGRWDETKYVIISTASQLEVFRSLYGYSGRISGLQVMSPREAISLYTEYNSRSEVRVENCILQRYPGMQSGAPAAISASGNDGGIIIAANNILLGNWGNGIDIAPAGDGEEAEEYFLLNNLVDGAQGSAISVDSYDSTVEVYAGNNVALNCGGPDYAFGGEGNTVKVNQSNFGQDGSEGSTVATVQQLGFMDAAAGDYRLTPTSVLRGAATVKGSYAARDITGLQRIDPWDAGPFAYVSAAPPAPTVRTVTVGPAGQGYDYTTLYNALAAEAKDLDGLNRLLRILVHPMVDTVWCAIRDWITNETCYLHILGVTGPNGERYHLRPNHATSALFVEQTDVKVICENFDIQNMRAVVTGETWGTSLRTNTIAANGNVIVRRCWIRRAPGQEIETNNNGVRTAQVFGRFEMSNCLVTGAWNSNALYVSTSNGGRVDLWNNTVIGPNGVGVRVTDHNATVVVTARNNLVVGAGGAAYSFGANNTKVLSANASDDDTGQIALPTGDAIFVDPEVADYRLRYSSPARGIGEDLSDLFTIDRDGVTRTAPWSVGAYVHVETGPDPDPDPDPDPESILSFRTADGFVPASRQLRTAGGWVSAEVKV